MSRIFIDRPIFAWVLAIVVMIAGIGGLLSLPVAHIMGFASLLGLAGAGIPAWFLPRFRAEAVLDAIETRRASIFVGVPAMYRMLLEAGAEHRDLSSVRIWGSGADAMPSELAQKFKSLGATASLPVVGPFGVGLLFYC